MPQRRRTDSKRYLLLPLLSLVVAIVLRLFVFDIYWVETSPVPERIPHRSWVMVSRISSPRVGDLVLLSPQDTKDKPAILSKVIATQGDTIECYGGRLYVNGTDMAQMPKDERYQINLNAEEVWLFAPQPSEGLDARHMGLVKRKNIIGRIILHLSL